MSLRERRGIDYSLKLYLNQTVLLDKLTSNEIYRI